MFVGVLRVENYLKNCDENFFYTIHYIYNTATASNLIRKPNYPYSLYIYILIYVKVIMDF